MRLDEERLEALRSWGERLRRSGDDESVAVGRALLMLAEEIDQLQIELRLARLQPGEGEPLPSNDEIAEEEEPVTSSLQGRLQRAFRRNPRSVSGEPPETASDLEPDEAESAKSWIEQLRRQG